MNEAFLASLLLSLKVSALATLGVAGVGGPLAYALARGPFRGREALDMLLTLPLVLPPTVTGYYLVLLLGRGGLVGGPLYRLTGWSVMFTWEAAAVASFVVALPLMIKTARAAFEAVDRRMLHASATLGHPEWSTALRVTVPLAWRGLAAGVALSFARALGEFGATLMLAGNIPGRTDTVPLAIYSSAASGDWAGANLMVGAFTLVSGLLLYLTNRLQSVRTP
jgi:molybdate transport system permease protein